MQPASNSSPGICFLAEPIFIAANLTYYWSDVAVAGWLWGDWKVLEEQARERLACLEHLEIAGEEDGVAEDVQVAANEFRYRMNLITADETLTWLAAHNLAIEDWTTYMKGAVLRQRCEEKLEEITKRHTISDHKVDQVILIDAICGGWLSKWAHKLAGRVAIAARCTDVRPDDDAASEAEGTALPRLPLVLRSLASVPERLQERLVALMRLERTFEEFRLSVATAEAIEERIRNGYLEWMRIDGDLAVFGDEPQAREAILCVREEGQALVDVAVEAGTEARPTSLYLGDLADGLRSVLLSARAGEVVGPFEWHEGLGVLHVRHKVPPTSGDGEVRNRAESELMTRIVEFQVAEHVQWQIPR
jgi:hypothetical protein